MLRLDYVRMQIEPIYRIAFVDWVLADSMEMPAYLHHMGKALISVGVDLDMLQVDILEGCKDE